MGASCMQLLTRTMEATRHAQHAKKPLPGDVKGDWNVSRPAAMAHQTRREAAKPLSRLTWEGNQTEGGTENETTRDWRGCRREAGVMNLSLTWTALKGACDGIMHLELFPKRGGATREQLIAQNGQHEVNEGDQKRHTPGSESIVAET